MTDYTLRVAVFLLFVSVLLGWQWRRPFYAQQHQRQRWRHNLSLFAMDALLVRICQPLLLAGVALLPSVPFAPLTLMPDFAALLVALVVFDVLIYWQHRLFHQLPWLWRFHRVHHSDPELDTSSAIRFHPAEILFSLVIKATAIWLLGIPAIAVLTFDILLNACALFNHTNVKLPTSVEKRLRTVLITPSLHRIHHSRHPIEANHNFGFCLSLWDRIFQSYLGQSSDPQHPPSIGLPGTKNYAPSRFKSLLFMPFTFNVKEKESSS